MLLLRNMRGGGNKVTSEEWYKRAEGGTSGDMVYSILSDWEKEICLARLGLMCEWTPEEEGSNWYQTACAFATPLDLLVIIFGHMADWEMRQTVNLSPSG